MLLALAGGAAVLQSLGPPPVRVVAAAPSSKAAIAQTAPAMPSKPAVTATVPPAPSANPALPPPRPLHAPGRDTPGPVADPMPALGEAAVPPGPAPLPRIAADGRTPMEVYAAGFDPSSRAPRVALILGGIGLDTAASQKAIADLPGGITLAVSPYAANPARLLNNARMTGHEYLLELPLEPVRFPLNDPGNEALLTGAPPGQNQARLTWALSRFAGYVGAIGALAGMQGERFAGSPTDMDRLLHRLAARGLLYIDPRPGQTPLPGIWGRDVDVSIDAGSADAAAMDAALKHLSDLARQNGSALGYASTPMPVALARIAIWANALATQGLALAPVSAVVHAPPRPAPSAAKP